MAMMRWRAAWSGQTLRGGAPLAVGRVGASPSFVTAEVRRTHRKSESKHVVLGTLLAPLRRS